MNAAAVTVVVTVVDTVTVAADGAADGITGATHAAVTVTTAQRAP